MELVKEEETYRRNLKQLEMNMQNSEEKKKVTLREILYKNVK